MKHKQLASAVIALIAMHAHAADSEPSKLLRDERYACLPAAAPQGMNWSHGRWDAAGFKEPENFTLDIAEIQYLNQPRRRVMTIKDSSSEQHCSTPWIFGEDRLDSCSDNGVTFVFSKRNGRGAISYLQGATTDGIASNSVSVMPFTCQPL